MKYLLPQNPELQNTGITDFFSFIFFSFFPHKKSGLVISHKLPSLLSILRSFSFLGPDSGEWVALHLHHVNLWMGLAPAFMGLSASYWWFLASYILPIKLVRPGLPRPTHSCNLKTHIYFWPKKIIQLFERKIH